jgi:hypothetical protein
MIKETVYLEGAGNKFRTGFTVVGTPTSNNNFCLRHFLFIIIIIFYLVSWGGLRPSPFGTSATNWPIVPAPNDG